MQDWPLTAALSPDHTHKCTLTTAHKQLYCLHGSSKCILYDQVCVSLMCTSLYIQGHVHIAYAYMVHYSTTNFLHFTLFILHNTTSMTNVSAWVYIQFTSCVNRLYNIFKLYFLSWLLHHFITKSEQKHILNWIITFLISNHGVSRSMF